MSRVCDLISAKKPMSGHNVSHSKRRTTRKFNANLQAFTVESDIFKRKFRLKLATNTIRTIDKHNGFDGFLRNVKSAKLTPFARQLKKNLFVIEGKPESKPKPAKKEKAVKTAKVAKPKKAEEKKPDSEAKAKVEKKEKEA